MEEIRDDLDEKWIEEEESRKMEFLLQLRVPGRPDTLKIEKSQSQLVFLKMKYRQCTRSTGYKILEEITETWSIG